MAPSIWASGKTATVTAVARKSGRMAVTMKAIGNIIKLMAKGVSFTPTAMSTRATGSMIKLKAKGSTSTPTGPSTKVTGWKINKMVTGLNVGQMKLNTVENTKKAKNMAKDNLSGLTDHNLKVSFIRTIFMALVCILGRMDASMMVNGSKIKCTVRVYLHGVMEESTQDSMKMIKNKDMVSLPGQMGRLIKVAG